MKIFQRSCVLFSKNLNVHLQALILKNKVEQIVAERKKTLLNGYLGKSIYYEPEEVWSECYSKISNVNYNAGLKSEYFPDVDLVEILHQFNDECSEKDLKKLLKDVEEQEKSLKKIKQALDLEVQNSNKKV